MVVSIIEIAIGFGGLFCLIYLIFLIQKVLRTSETFVAEFRTHFDDAFLRRLMKRMGIRQSRNL